MGVYYAEAGCAGDHTGTKANPFATTAQMVAGTGAGDLNNITGKFREQLNVESDVTYQQWAWRPDWIQDGSDIKSGFALVGAEYELACPIEAKICFWDDNKMVEGAAGGLAAGEWDWVANVLYVKDNPAGHVVEAGQRGYGVVTNTKTGFVVDGVIAQKTNSHGAYSLNSNSGIIRNFVTRQNLFYGVMSHNQQSGVLEISRCITPDAPLYGAYVSSQSGGTILIDGCDISASTSYNVYLNTITGGTLTVKNNKVRDGLSHGVYSNAVNGGLATIRVEHNVIWGNAGRGYWGLSSPSINVCNNTIADNGVGDNAVRLEGASTGNYLRNNAVVDSAFSLVVDAFSTVGCDLDYNDFYGFSSGFHWNGSAYATLALYQAASGQDANSISADPLFEDATNDVFLLKAASPCINAGTTVAGAPIKDIVNRAVPQGAAPDIGAYEFGPHPKPTRSVHGFRKSGRRYSRQR